MPSARRTMSAHSSEQKRKAAGQLSKVSRGAAAAAAQQQPSASGSATSADNTTTSTLPAAHTQAQPPLTLPPHVHTVWSNLSALTPTSPSDSAALAAVTSFLDACGLESQFRRLNALMQTILDCMGVSKKTKKGNAVKGAKAAVAGEGSDAAPQPAAPLSPSVRHTLLLGTLELLGLKLATTARAPLYQALEALDGPSDAGGDSTLLSEALLSVFERLEAAPSMPLLTLFEQVSNFRPAQPTFANNSQIVLRALTRAVEEIVLKRAQAAVASSSGEEGEQQEDEDEEAPSSTIGSSSSAQWMSPSEQTRFMLRTAVTYILKYRKEVLNMFVSMQQQPSDQQILYQLTYSISRVLMSPNVHRDVLTQCGLILVVLLQLSVQAHAQVSGDEVDPLMVQMVYFTCFATRETKLPKELVSKVPVLEWMHEADPNTNKEDEAVYPFCTRLPSLARLACLRSVASHSSLSVLFHPAPLPSGSSLVTPCPTTLILSHLYPLVFHQALHEVYPHVRAYALQTLEVLWSKAKQFVAQVEKEKNTPAGLDSSEEDSALLSELDRLLDGMLELMLLNFEHPFKSIPTIIKALFVQYVDIKNLLMSRGLDGAEEIKRKRQEYWSTFIGQLLQRERVSEDATEATIPSSSSSPLPVFHSSSRGLFTMLLLLLPQLSVVSLLDRYPSLMTSLYSASQVRPLFGLVSQVVEAIVAQAKGEMITAPMYEGDAEEGEQAAGGQAHRSKQKRRKDEIKQRIKAKAIEAGIEETKEQQQVEAASSAPSSSSAASPRESTPAFRAQLSAWRSLWTPLVVSGLLSELTLWRHDVSAGTLTNLLKQQDTYPDALEAILRAVREQAAALPRETATAGSTSIELRQSRALVSVLKTARRIGLIASKDLDTRIKKEGDQEVGASEVSHQLPITSSQLLSALLHSDADLRSDALEFLCSNLQSAELMSGLEIDLLRTSLPYLIKVASPPLRAKLVHCMQRLLIRVRDSVAREVREGLELQKRMAKAQGGATTAVAPAATTEAEVDPSVAHLSSSLSPLVLSRIGASVSFLGWLERFLFDSLYPSAPLERTSAALELYRLLMDLFLPSSSSTLTPSSSTPASVSELDIWQLGGVMFTPDHTRVLINLLASNWERVRGAAVELLTRFPTPLPGYEHEGGKEESSLYPLLNWAATLCRSARMREAEGGSLAIQLLFQKYVVQMHWCIDFHQMATSSMDGAAGAAQPLQPFKVAANAQEAVLFFLNSLHTHLRFQLSVLLQSSIHVRYTSPNSRLHGSLLCFRLVLAEVPWTSWDRVGEEVKQQWKSLTSRMVTTMKEVAEVSLSMHIPTNAAAALREGQQTNSSGGAEGEGEAAAASAMDCRGHLILPKSTSAAPVAGTDEFADQHGEQMVVVSSWLAVKEVSLGLGEWISVAPLPSAARPSASPFSMEELRAVGSLFFAILSCSKHNGVLENAHEGFLSVCGMLLENNDALLGALVESWFVNLMTLITDPFTNDAWIRRSRGIAYCLLAMLQAEPTGTKQVGNTELMAVKEEEETSSTSVPVLTSPSSGSMLSRCMYTLLHMSQVDTDTVGPLNPTTGLHEDGWKLKVHGLNILRAIFRDSVLAVDASPYIATALQVAIQGFTHANWNVRNSSLITFAALLSKAVRGSGATRGGNTATASGEGEDGGAASSGVLKSGMTALDFFTLYPSLHSFLLEQLQLATATVDQSASTADEVATLEKQTLKAGKDANPADWTSDMHPSLYPILLILSRLTPSSSTSNAASSEDSSTSLRHLDMHAFLPSIRQCASHPFYMARWMASKAVVSLIPLRSLQEFVTELVDSIPEGAQQSLDHNRIQGVLLQLDSILRFHHLESTLLASGDKKTLGTALLTRLLSPSMLWLSDAATMRCAPIRLLYLQLVEVCIEYVEAGSDEEAVRRAIDARKQLLVLTAQACDLPQLDASTSSFVGIGVDLLRAEAASMLVRCICTLPPGSLPPTVDLTSLILSLISDSLGEVYPSLSLLESLLSTLKRCFQLHPARMSTHLDFQRVIQSLLEGVLIKHVTDFVVSAGTNHTVQQLVLQLMLAYWEMAQGEVARSSGLDLGAHWSPMLRYTVDSVDIGVKSSAFSVLSLCLHTELDAVLASPTQQILHDFLVHATTWMELLHSFMDDEQPAQLRYSCVLAIKYSGLMRATVDACTLELDSGVIVPRVLAPSSTSSTSPLINVSHQHGSLATLKLSMWCSVILHLLQDDNETVRTDMAALVGEHMQQQQTDKQEGAAVTSGQALVGRVMEQSFAFLTETYWRQPLLAHYLMQLLQFYTTYFKEASVGAGVDESAALVPSPSPSPSASSPSPSASPSAASFKLFEHEKANTVIEELLLMELAAHALAQVMRKLVQEAKKQPQEAAAQQLWDELTSQLEGWSRNLSSSLPSLPSSSWVGGVSFQESAFVHLYGLVLGVSSVLGVSTLLTGTPAEARWSQALSILQATLEQQEGASLHPLLQRALGAIRQMAAGAPATSIGFLTPVSQ